MKENKALHAVEARVNALHEVGMRNRVRTRWVSYQAAVLAVCFLVPVLGNCATNGVVAVLGSWVAKGYNVGSGTLGGSYALGYAGLLTTYLAPSGWVVTNLSVSEDAATNLLSTYESGVVSADPDHVLVGFSLSDEGLAGASDPAAVSETFRSRLTNIVGRVRANGMSAIVGLCYPYNSYRRRSTRI
jgi:lysophospholipase L1-like esterase